ncbi:MAG: uncharacterized protein A8A55_0652 [Amphiamblys sp. WSBS2006]|nr:MAG: uncharacterized protein A8A55_0652 [Amphiamblys sp. WSBS2006]
MGEMLNKVDDFTAGGFVFCLEGNVPAVFPEKPDFYDIVEEKYRGTFLDREKTLCGDEQPSEEEGVKGEDVLEKILDVLDRKITAIETKKRFWKLWQFSLRKEHGLLLKTKAHVLAACESRGEEEIVLSSSMEKRVYRVGEKTKFIFRDGSIPVVVFEKIASRYDWELEDNFYITKNEGWSLFWRSLLNNEECIEEEVEPRLQDNTCDAGSQADSTEPLDMKTRADQFGVQVDLFEGWNKRLETQALRLKRRTFYLKTRGHLLETRVYRVKEQNEYLEKQICQLKKLTPLLEERASLLETWDCLLETWNHLLEKIESTASTEPPADTSEPLTDAIQEIPNNAVLPTANPGSPAISARSQDDSTEPLDDSTEPLDDNKKPSTTNTEAPTEKTEALADDTEASTDDTEASTDDTEEPADDTEASTDDTEEPADDTEASTDDTEASTEKTEAPVENKRPSTENTETPAGTTKLEDSEQNKETSNPERKSALFYTLIIGASLLLVGAIILAGIFIWKRQRQAAMVVE